MKKRLLVLLTAVAMMVAMLAMSVAPALADKPIYECTQHSDGFTFKVGQAKFAKELNRSGLFTCVRVHQSH